MSVAVLLITHDKIGQAMLDTADKIMGSLPLTIKRMGVSMKAGLEDTLEKAHAEIDDLDEGDGVLILTDLFGATPSNIARQLQAANIAVITGLNLPMLIRVLNYPNLSLPEMVDKAVSGAHDGIIVIQTAGE
jgi:PTS system ascorbate-specific IIA component